MARPRFLDRTLAPVLERAAKSFPAIVLTGPRQSGKTTLCKRLFGDSHAYCSLDDPGVRTQALQDPALLLLRFPPPVVIDEIQHAPELLHHLKRDIDENRTTKGRYVITGSQLFPLMQGVTESLAGRAAVTTLLSLTIRESHGQPDERLDWREMLLPDRSPLAPPPLRETITRIIRGGYPEPAVDGSIDQRLWQSSYVQTYLERDVRTLRAVGDLNDFQRLLFTLAARSGGLINFEDLSRDLGVTGKTVKAWVSVLEASGQVRTLKPYHVSLGKRIVKRPKIYYLDSGTLAFLLGVVDPDAFLTSPLAGPLFETTVLGQLERLFLHRGDASRLFFWRTAAGHEVDFIVDDGQRLIPIEAKLTTNPTSRDAVAVEAFQDLFPRRAGKGLVVCLCRERFPLTRRVDAVPLGSF